MVTLVTVYWVRTHPLTIESIDVRLHDEEVVKLNTKIKPLLPDMETQSRYRIAAFIQA